jgi:hypothetical protein
VTIVEKGTFAEVTKRAKELHAQGIGWTIYGDRTPGVRGVWCIRRRELTEYEKAIPGINTRARDRLVAALRTS